MSGLSRGAEPRALFRERLRKMMRMAAFPHDPISEPIRCSPRACAGQDHIWAPAEVTQCQPSCLCAVSPVKPCYVDLAFVRSPKCPNHFREISRILMVSQASAPALPLSQPSQATHRGWPFQRHPLSRRLAASLCQTHALTDFQKELGLASLSLLVWEENPLMQRCQTHFHQEPQ